MGDLLPCPFCGHTDLRTAGGSTAGYVRWVECLNTECEMEGPLRDTADTARAAWNTRGPHPLLADARELLSAALESVDVTNMDVLSGQIRAFLEATNA